MTLPKSLTTVTPLSATLALILFITLPIIGYLYGMRYQSAMDYNRPSRSLLSIISLAPQVSTVGKSVTIIGTGFTATNNYIYLGAGSIGPLDSSDHVSLSFTIPAQIQGGCGADPKYLFNKSNNNIHCLAIVVLPIKPGDYPISVINSTGTSNQLTLTIH